MTSAEVIASAPPPLGRLLAHSALSVPSALGLAVYLCLVNVAWQYRDHHRTLNIPDLTDHITARPRSAVLVELKPPLQLSHHVRSAWLDFLFAFVVFILFVVIFI